MPHQGDIEHRYCCVCAEETDWAYVRIERRDGVFGLENMFHPEAHQVAFWRCLKHTLPDGRMNEETLKKHRRGEPSH